MAEWKLQDAKAKFSEVMRLVKNEPQMITVHGKQEAVLVSKEFYDRVTHQKESLVKMMRESPLCGVNLEIDRNKSLSRDVEDL